MQIGGVLIAVSLFTGQAPEPISLPDALGPEPAPRRFDRMASSSLLDELPPLLLAPLPTSAAPAPAPTELPRAVPHVPALPEPDIPSPDGRPAYLPDPARLAPPGEVQGAPAPGGVVLTAFPGSDPGSVAVQQASGQEPGPALPAATGPAYQGGMMSNGGPSPAPWTATPRGWAQAPAAGPAGPTQEMLPPPSQAPGQPGSAQDAWVAELADELMGPPANPWVNGCVPAVVPKKMVWGELDTKLFPDAGRIAPNGIAYDPLFTLDLNFNVWLCPQHRVYGFGYARYWGGRGGQGQTHGNFDYTRREFDLDAGFAWNYYKWLELRGTGYGHENFNRGVSQIEPHGNTNDGAGLEQRLYLSPEYDLLGQHGFNISRATFVSLGYYETKSLIGGDGKQYRPGLFGRAYLIWDIPSTRCYLFGDFYQVFDKNFTPRMLYSDVGLAVVPFKDIPLLEVRLGSEIDTDWNASGSVRNMSLPYVSLRLNY